MRISLLVVALAALAAACKGNVFSLEVGDCFNDPVSATSAGYEVADVPVVGCSESHDNEVYAIANYPASDDAPYPGGHTLDDFAETICNDTFYSYVGTSPEVSSLRMSYIRPTREGWESHRDREVTCLLYHRFGTKLNSSMKGSGE